MALSSNIVVSEDPASVRINPGTAIPRAPAPQGAISHTHDESPTNRNRSPSGQSAIKGEKRPEQLIPALSLPNGQGSLHVLNGGTIAFARILEEISNARHSIYLRAFVWRDDRAGNDMAHALLRAADRGVTVTIRKDEIGANYECLGGSQKSFFHDNSKFSLAVRAWFLGHVYGGESSQRAKRSPRRESRRPLISRRQFVGAQNMLASALMAHRNVHVDRRKGFDHAKLFIFDERRLILGSMGIGDNHREDWLDLMVQIEGRGIVERLMARLRGDVPLDITRTIDFLVHSGQLQGHRRCPLLGDRLAIIDSAARRLTIEMAYLGDRRFTNALLRALRRDVALTIVTSSNSDVLGDVNRATCDEILRRSGAPDHLRIVLHPKMVHSKVMIADGRYTDMGSANFTTLSHGVYDEVDVFIDSRVFARTLESIIEKHASEGQAAGTRVDFRPHIFHVERAFVSLMSHSAPRGKSAGEADYHDG